MTLLEEHNYHVQLPVFEGPLDLLLHLVEQEELDITKIALARVTDQYMAYLAQLERRQANELSDFLVVAAKLLLIKSEALLPQPKTRQPEEEDVGDDLVRQLKAYKRFKEVSKLLKARDEEGLRAYVRIASLPSLEPELDLAGATVDDLATAVREAFDMLSAPPVDDVVKSVPVTIDEQIERIETELVHHSHVQFRDFLSQARSRVEVIVTLLAVLELIKQKRVRVVQQELFGEIVIERELSDEEPETADAPASATDR